MRREVFLHFLLLITIFLAGCSPRNFIKREISSAQGLPLATQQFYDFVKSEKFTAHNCSTVLMEIYSDVFKIDARIFNKKEILQDSGKILNNLWRSRLEIGQRLKLWAEEANLDNDCVDAIRSTMRAIRFIEDYVGELYVVNSPETTIPALTGNAPYLLLNPHFGDSLDLKVVIYFFPVGLHIPAQPSHESQMLISNFPI